MNISSTDYAAILARLNKNQIREAVDPVDDESDLQEQCIAECRRRGWFVVYSRVDLPTRTPLGTPDLIIFADQKRVFVVELKAKNGKLRPNQQAVKAQLEHLGHTVHVIYSFEGFLEAIK